MRVGVLTGGGDCPGLNAAIRAIVRKGVDRYGHVVIGFRDGWRGALENQTTELTLESTRGIIHRGGTILGSSRTNPYKGGEDGTPRVRESMQSLHLDGLIAIGGEDTRRGANKLRAGGLNVIGLPKTSDNDRVGTDINFRFDTPAPGATAAIHRVHPTPG